MTVKLLTEPHLKFQCLKVDCTGLSVYTKSCQNATLLESHVVAQIRTIGPLCTNGLFLMIQYNIPGFVQYIEWRQF